MSDAGVIQSEVKGWGRRLMRLLALMVIALHVFTVEGHVHVAAFSGQSAAASGAALDAHAIQSGADAPSLFNPSSQAPCVFCQTMAAAGPALLPVALLLVLFGAAALVALLFGQRQVLLQPLHTWRSRAPPLAV